MLRLPFSHECLVALAVLLVPQAAGAQVWARVPIESLDVGGAEFPAREPDEWIDSDSVRATLARAVLTGAGEVQVEFAEGGNALNAGPEFSAWRLGNVRSGALLIELPAARDVQGLLFLAEPGGRSMRRLEFRVPASAFGPAAREAFLEAKALHCESLAGRERPGSAWFRFQAARARAALGDAPLENGDGARPPRPADGDDLQSTFELFSGQRAVAENLRLERELFVSEEAAAEVELASIRGVATAAYDWSAEIEGLAPEPDALARWVIADQHAVFFPSFDALLGVLDEFERNGAGLWTLAEARAEDAGVRARYERQLCLPLDGRTRALGGLAIRSLAVTGSDPYLRSGSDVCVLFESDQAALLAAFLCGEMQRGREATPGAVAEEFDVSGLPVRGVRSPDRSLCAYLTQLDEHTLAVTNSVAQLHYLAELGGGTSQRLSQAPEYTFFRARYPRSASSEQALLVLSDATIRRWAGPGLRIAASRRTRAAAWLAHAQCEALAGLEPRTELPDGSALVWEAGRARSPRWGTLEWMTPLVELRMSHVSLLEQRAYDTFRERYERSWSTWFDPIALCLTREGANWEADLTVRPLVASSDYRQWRDVVGRAQLGPRAGDPHPGTLAHFAVALDSDGWPLSFATDLLDGQGDLGGLVDPFGWISAGVGVYLEDDPEFFAGWCKARAANEQDLWLEENWMRFPIGVHFDSKDPLKLALCASALRAFVERASPGLLRWETREHAGDTYAVVIGEGLSGDSPASWPHIYYATLPDAWILSLREDVLWAALARRKAAAAHAPAQAWLGESLALRLDAGLLALVREFTREEALLRAQRAAWAPLALLNDWHGRFPESDPIELYGRCFGVRLVDAGGEPYVWDEAWATYASPAFGHPGAQLAGPAWPAAFEGLREIDMGVTFEADGLRARARLTRE